MSCVTVPLSKHRTDALVRAVRSLARDSASRADEASSHLATAVAAQRIAEIAERVARVEVASARARDGVSWADVGDAFGINRKSAHERLRSGPDGPHTRSARLREG